MCKGALEGNILPKDNLTIKIGALKKKSDDAGTMSHVWCNIRHSCSEINILRNFLAYPPKD